MSARITLLRLFATGLLFVALVLIGASGCSKGKTDHIRPKVLMSQATLTSVLTEVHLVEAAMNMRRNNGQEFENQKNALFDAIFTHYGITPELLEANLLYYNQHPAVMEKVYQDVIDSLLRIQQELRLE
ncbi:MAG: DUF4296 domain-containing protein [Bacteroidetes bacterium]|nr:DUF4296 domain-containing protein [Bacteroidota bacterium]